MESLEKGSYTTDFTNQEAGEVIKEVREKHAMLSVGDFAKKIGVKVATLESVEDGKGAHGFNILKKVEDAFPEIKLEIRLTLS